MNELSKLEWSILNSLADDREAVALIMGLITDDFPRISRREVAETVYKLYERGLALEAYGKSVNFDILVHEPEGYEDAVYWFELSERGDKYWEEYAPIYLGEPIDWSKSWTARLNYEREEGYIEGTSEEVCLVGLEQIDKNESWRIDRDTLVYSRIDGFKAKYYKYIRGGHKITFKLKKR